MNDIHDPTDDNDQRGIGIDCGYTIGSILLIGYLSGDGVRGYCSLKFALLSFVFC